MSSKLPLYFFYLFSLGLILVLSYYVFFDRLGVYPLRLWDEGRNATNALEMSRNGNLIVTYFNGLPDLWNLKPPLHIWLVALSFKLFGVSEYSLRLISAFSAVILIISLYLVGLKVIKNVWVSILSSLIILSSMGFPDTHIGRTGDYDALLTLFIFLANLFTFLYLEKKTISFSQFGIFILG